MPMTRPVMALVAAAMVLTAVGCANNDPKPVSAQAAQSLAPFVSALRDAASHKNIAAVRARVADLDGEVVILVHSGDLTQKRGRAIQDAASALLSDFTRKYTPTAPPTTASPSVTPTETVSPTPTVTVTVPPTESASPTATDTVGNGDGNGNGNGNSQGNGQGPGGPPGHNK